MRIACLQFAPVLGDVDNNLNRADQILNKANPKDLDLLVLPELAFTGYNFRSLKHITPFLEPTSAGITSLWARTTALKYDCTVTVGYPEKVDISSKWPASPEYYNSAITVNSDGETIANYRKSFLYYTDETWALEGPDGFYDGEIEGLGRVAIGICMDLNPYKFEAPWDEWEFAYHVLHKEANLVILSMAWLTRDEPETYSIAPKEPDMTTLSYWLARLEPLIRVEGDEEIIIVLANRTGVEEEAVYAGTSAVLGIQDGEVKVYGILGRGERKLLLVDTDEEPQAKLISGPTSTSDDITNAQDILSTQNDFPEHEGFLASIDQEPSCDQPGSPLLPNSPRSPSFNAGDSRSNMQSGVLTTRFSMHSPLGSPLDGPASPNSPNASRVSHHISQEPVKTSQDVENEHETRRAMNLGIAGDRKSPHSASAVNGAVSWDQARGLSPPVRIRSSSPRPKSTHCQELEDIGNQRGV